MTVNEVLENGKEASCLYDYLFHFNNHRKRWFAIPRGELSNYFNGEADDMIISSENSLKDLIMLVIEFEIKK